MQMSRRPGLGYLISGMPADCSVNIYVYIHGSVYGQDVSFVQIHTDRLQESMELSASDVLGGIEQALACIRGIFERKKTEMS